MITVVFSFVTVSVEPRPTKQSDNRRVGCALVGSFLGSLSLSVAAAASVANTALGAKLAGAVAIIGVGEAAALGKLALTLKEEAAKGLLLPLALSLKGTTNKGLLSASTLTEHHATTASESALEADSRSLVPRVASASTEALAVHATATTTTEARELGTIGLGRVLPLVKRCREAVLSLGVWVGGAVLAVGDLLHLNLLHCL